MLPKVGKIIPDDLTKYSEGSFSGFVVLHQLKKKTYFNADISVFKDKLRVDLVASMGIPIMSLLIIGQNNTVIFFQTKHYYSGKKLTTVLSSIFPFSIDLSIFTDILFEKAPHNAIWQCQKNAKGKWKQCVHQNTHIKWIRKKARSLSIHGPGWSFTFHYSKFKPKARSGAFVLKIPAHFKAILLP